MFSSEMSGQQSIAEQASRSVKWPTLAWGLLFLSVSVLLIWALLNGYANFWSILFLFNSSQWLIAGTVSIGVLILLLGLGALGRKKRQHPVQRPYPHSGN
ncbi:MAG: hypothetical protein WBA28_04420 [Microbacteriaceae bacterium]